MPVVTEPLSDQALDTLFRTARTHNGWVDEVLPEQVFHDIYDLMKWGPTSANISPARFVWVASKEGKEKLAAVSMQSNGDSDGHHRHRHGLSRAYPAAVSP
jgi:3-hydroxypropanoate dehydrogenase